MLFKNSFSLLALILLLTSCSHYQLRSKLTKAEKEAHYSFIYGKAGIPHKPQFALNDEQYVTPASCLKVVTAMIATKVLGWDYKYETKLYSLEQGKSIMVSFSGDPTLTSYDLIKLFASLKNKKFDGSLIIDISAFQTTEHSHNIILDSIGTEASPPITAAIIDRNQFMFTITPTKNGELAKIDADENCNYLSKILTSTETSNISADWGLHPTTRNEIILTGKIAEGSLPIKMISSPKTSAPFLMDKIRQVLKVNNIQFKNNIWFVSDPSMIPVIKKTIDIHYSAPLKDYLAQAFKVSDNLTFDALYLTMLSNEYPQSLKWEDGHQMVKNHLKKDFDIDIGDNLIIDGSGISRYNRLQPKKLWEVLQVAYQDKELVKLFSSVIDKDSTLYARKLSPKILAKTGTLSQISCLCGYYQNGQSSKTFVITTTNFLPPATEVRKNQNEILGIVFK